MVTTRSQRENPPTVINYPPQPAVRQTRQMNGSSSDNLSPWIVTGYNSNPKTIENKPVPARRVQLTTEL